MASVDFLQALAAVQDEISKAEFSGWEPPPGRHQCQYTGLKTGVKLAEDGTSSVWLRANFTIVTGPYTGQQFGVFATSKRAQSFGPLFALVTASTKDTTIEQTRDTAALVDALESLAGQIVLVVGVKANEVRGRDGQVRTYRDYYIDQVVDLKIA